jgi:hypothetical protein
MNHAGPFAPLLRAGIRASDAGQRATGGGLTDSVPPRSTRIDLLAGYRDRGHEVWLELGLQSANDATLARVNRGHGLTEYRAAVLQAQRCGLVTVKVTHSALRIPLALGEMAGVRETVMAAATYILRGGADAMAVSAAQGFPFATPHASAPASIARLEPVLLNPVAQLLPGRIEHACGQAHVVAVALERLAQDAALHLVEPHRAVQR